MLRNFVATALVGLARLAYAQSPSEPSCSGQTISRISIDAGRPPFEGSARKWRAIARAVGLHHATTRASVIRTYLVLREGDVCTDERRAESERILRALPFLAGASVKTIPDSLGGVRLEIATTDEIPALVSAAFHGTTPAAVGLGNSNISGLGIRAFAGINRGNAYRNGAHLQASQYAFANQPLVAAIDLSKDQLGGHMEFGLSRPFLTDLQRGSFSATYRTAVEYLTFLRPSGDNAALAVNHDRWSVGAVARTEIGGLVALLGGAAMGTRITPGSQLVLVTDTGLAPSGDTAIRRQYAPFHASRLGGLVGVRRITYSALTGYDALFAQQDVMTGIQVGALVAPGMVMHGHGDVLFASSVYAGAVIGRSMFGAQFESETRRDFSAGMWDSMLGSGRAAWYFKMSPGVLFTTADEFSVGRRGLLPTQLGLSDPLGGVRGFSASRLAGEERNVARGELRWAHPALVRRSDVGVALFGDVGTLWAGRVPYGGNVTQASVGFSLLAAYPTQSKRVYRVDFAMPVNRRGLRSIEVRFSSGDPTAAFWREPDDVTRSRLAPVPSSLFAWPAR